MKFKQIFQIALITIIGQCSFAASGAGSIARPDIVQECIRQHNRGSIITICWHAVPPTADEPIAFRPEPWRSSPGGPIG